MTADFFRFWSLIKKQKKKETCSGGFSYLINQNNQDSNRKTSFGFRKIQEKLENKVEFNSGRLTFNMLEKYYFLSQIIHKWYISMSLNQSCLLSNCSISISCVSKLLEVPVN